MSTLCFDLSRFIPALDLTQGKFTCYGCNDHNELHVYMNGLSIITISKKLRLKTNIVHVVILIFSVFIIIIMNDV